MLGKLLKYEIKEKSRLLVVLAFFMLACNIIFYAIQENYTPFIYFMEIFAWTWVLPLLALSFTQLLSCVENVFGNKSNQTFALPVKNSQIILSQILASIVSFIVISGFSILSVMFQLKTFNPKTTILSENLMIFLNAGPIYMYFFAINVVLFPAVVYFAATFIAKFPLKFPGMRRNISEIYHESSPVFVLMFSLVVVILMSFGGSIAGFIGTFFQSGITLDFSGLFKSLHPTLRLLSFNLYIPYLETISYLLIVLGFFTVASIRMHKAI